MELQCQCQAEECHEFDYMGGGSGFWLASGQLATLPACLHARTMNVRLWSPCSM